MKNVVIKISAVLLAVWYSMSVIGFDVHTCNGSGRSFVVTFIEGLTCEDIHPEHTCGKASCCGERHDTCCSGHEECHVHDHSECPFCDGVSISSKSCCSNDYQSLGLTGTPSAQDHGHFDGCGCGLSPCLAADACRMADLNHENNLIAYIPRPDSGVGSACERQASLRVWRI